METLELVQFRIGMYKDNQRRGHFLRTFSQNRYGAFYQRYSVKQAFRCCVHLKDHMLHSSSGKEHVYMDVHYNSDCLFKSTKYDNMIAHCAFLEVRNMS